MILWLGFSFSVTLTSAQLTELAELPLTAVEKIAVDRLGDFYFVSKGRIEKYGSDGKRMNISQPSRTSVTLLEPWNPLRVFVYHRLDSSYEILDHYLELLERKKLNPAFAIDPKLVCPGGEHQLWILDQADNSLKLIDQLGSRLMLESVIDSTDTDHDFIYMRAYQNYLFVLDQRSGIFIFNNLGKPTGKIDVQGLTYFNFLGEELCYRKGGDLMLYDLYTGEVRKATELPRPKDIQSAIITDERVVVIRSKQVDIYAFHL